MLVSFCNHLANDTAVLTSGCSVLTELAGQQHGVVILVHDQQQQQPSMQQPYTLGVVKHPFVS